MQLDAIKITVNFGLSPVDFQVSPPQSGYRGQQAAVVITDTSFFSLQLAFSTTKILARHWNAETSCYKGIALQLLQNEDWSLCSFAFNCHPSASDQENLNDIQIPS